MSAEKQWISVGKAAEMLGDVHPETVRRYLQDDLLRGMRLTAKGHRRIELASVKELLAIREKSGEERLVAEDALRLHNRSKRQG